jgi:hypothetical protein
MYVSEECTTSIFGVEGNFMNGGVSFRDEISDKKLVTKFRLFCQ